MPVDKTPHAINFYSRSLAQFPNIQPVCTTKDFVDCLKESARTGLNQIKRNASSLPLWQIGDLSHSRADSLFDNVGNLTAQANSLVTAMQLFLPGPVKVYYGEELGLPSVNKSGGSQLMQWEGTNKGFTDLTGKLYFDSLPSEQAEQLNFKVCFFISTIFLIAPHCLGSKRRYSFSLESFQTIGWMVSVEYNCVALKKPF